MTVAMCLVPRITFPHPTTHFTLSSPPQPFPLTQPFPPLGHPPPSLLQVPALHDVTLSPAPTCCNPGPHGCPSHPNISAPSPAPVSHAFPPGCHGRRSGGEGTCRQGCCGTRGWEEGAHLPSCHGKGEGGGPPPGSSRGGDREEDVPFKAHVGEAVPQPPVPMGVDTGEGVGCLLVPPGLGGKKGVFSFQIPEDGE